MRTTLAGFALTFLLLLAPWAALAGGTVVRVVGPEPVAGNVAAQLAQRLPALDIRREDSLVKINPDAPAQLIVAVGANAFLSAVTAQRDSGAAVVGIALTRHVYRQAPKGRHTALFWDPDPAKQLRLAHALLPGARRAGIVLSAPDDKLLAALRSESSRFDIELSVAVVGGKDTLSRQLNKVLADSDFLLAIDDPGVFAAELAKTVLLTTYRHGKPVIGPTAAWVAAGSVASLSSGIVDTVDELAVWMPQLLAGGDLPPAGHLTRYRVATNPDVARSLQLSLPSVPVLEALVREEKIKP